MNISPVAQRLLNAIDDFMQESNKKEYRFTIEEQHKIEWYIAMLNNHINNLIDYELKQKEN